VKKQRAGGVRMRVQARLWRASERDGHGSVAAEKVAASGGGIAHSAEKAQRK